jgi:hypothetical protein
MSLYPQDYCAWNHNVAVTKVVMLILPLCDRIHFGSCGSMTMPKPIGIISVPFWQYYPSINNMYFRFGVIFDCRKATFTLIWRKVLLYLYGKYPLCFLCFQYFCGFSVNFSNLQSNLLIQYICTNKHSEHFTSECSAVYGYSCSKIF